jgi:hypothetical protein
MVERDQALEALRREVTGRGFAFATVLRVDDGGAAGFLRVRSGRRLHPHTLVVAADESSLALDHLLGEPLPSDDAEEWARGVVERLTEQLDTGVLRWGRRITLEDGTPAIDPWIDPGPPGPGYVTDVPLERPSPAGQRRLRRLIRRGRRRSAVTSDGRDEVEVVTIGGRIGLEPDPEPGEHLHDHGFDVRPGRAAHAGGRLVAWLQLLTDDRASAAPVGQLVVSWHDEPEAIARLEHLEHRPSAPAGAVEELVLAGVQTAADAGARRVEHQLADVDRLAGGMPWERVDGVSRLDAAAIP